MIPDLTMSRLNILQKGRYMVHSDAFVNEFLDLERQMDTLFTTSRLNISG